MDGRIEKQYVDLCARIPYGVKGTVYTDRYVNVKLLHVDQDRRIYVKALTDDKEVSDAVDKLITDVEPTVNFFKPYYRPVSDLTEEEIDRMFDILGIDKAGNDPSWIKINDASGIWFFLPDGTCSDDLIKVYDYLNSIHIDYRGYIELGFATAITKEELDKI